MSFRGAPRGRGTGANSFGGGRGGGGFGGRGGGKTFQFLKRKKIGYLVKVRAFVCNL